MLWEEKNERMTEGNETGQERKQKTNGKQEKEENDDMKRKKREDCSCDREKFTETVNNAIRTNRKHFGKLV